MLRPRLLVPAVSLAAAIVAGPILAGGALAADPVVVRPGDTLTSISKRHGVPIPRIVELNGLADPNRIYVGQRLRVTGASASAAPSPAPAAPAARARSHTVRLGETLTHIAARYDVTVGAIASANGIANPSRIFAGQRLNIPGAGGSASPGASVPASMAALMQRRAEVRRVIVEEAERYDVPVALALAVAWQESGWQQGVVSRAGAIGVMQLLPSTGEWVGEAMLGAPVDLANLRQNVRAGVRLLAHYLDRYDGNVDLVLAAYYQGQTAADRHGVYPISRPYVASIKALIRIFEG
ncbi:MAG TPA: LysM peptidoglycan-binding domain-containing protein [Candidatus Limnocylindrales bacterium]|nr:LysM peptidoglycan-binding domain-containing protein [Candidatus Limnocylindrales bacterium]